MSVITEKNFAGMDPASIPVADEYVRCNFSRSQPDTGQNPPVGIRLFPGDDTPRTFRNCNLFNCEPPPGSTVIDCNTWIVTTGELAHTEDLVIDGQVEDTIQYHDRTCHGKWVADAYERTGFPVTSPEDY